VKVNTDGSLGNNSTTCGGIFHDYQANCLGYFAAKIPLSSALHAEIHAVIIALELASSKGWVNLWIESDSAGKLGLS
jgi:ribonuclease HI